MQNQIKIDEPALIEIRKELHRHPELSGDEKKTASRIVTLLRERQPDDLIEEVGGHGVLAIYRGQQPGPTVIIRAELDALPIQETNTFEYKSTVAGVSHKCGHDGHMTILLGLAKHLSTNPPARGQVVLLFQPAEETGMGAEIVLQDPKFTFLQPDYVFALHNLPKYPTGSVIVRSSNFTASVKSLIVRLTGKMAHAAEPENGVNPGLPIAKILQEAVSLTNNDVRREDFAVVTPIHVEMGQIAYGVSAGSGVIRLTLRTWSDDEMKRLQKKLIDMINHTGLVYGIRIDLEWTQEFASTKNDDLAVEMIKEAAMVNRLELIETNTPFKWGEDFGAFTQQYKGAMFVLGAGMNTPALHNDNYDFPDEIIRPGIQMFASIINKILN